MDLQSIIDADWELLSSFNGSDSVFLDGFISTLTWGWTWLPLYIGWLYLVIKNNELPKVIAIISAVACCLLLTAVVDGMIVKPLVARPRPLNDPVFGHLVDTVHGIHSSDCSFFSAHSANTMGHGAGVVLLPAGEEQFVLLCHDVVDPAEWVYAIISRHAFPVRRLGRFHVGCHCGGLGLYGLLYHRKEVGS